MLQRPFRPSKSERGIFGLMARVMQARTMEEEEWRDDRERTPLLNTATTITAAELPPDAQVNRTIRGPFSNSVTMR